MQLLKKLGVTGFLQGLICLGIAQTSAATVYTYELENMSGQSAGMYLTLYDTGLNIFGDYTYVALDFNHPSSNVTLTYNSETNTLQLWGEAAVSSVTEYGHADSYYGDSLGQVWEFDFVWDTNVDAIGGEQYVVDQSHGNTGVLDANSKQLSLADMQNTSAGYSFALLLNSLGLQVGAGWFSIDGYGIGNNSFADIFFQVKSGGGAEVPEPSSIALLLTGGIGLVARRRRKAMH